MCNHSTHSTHSNSVDLDTLDTLDTLNNNVKLNNKYINCIDRLSSIAHRSTNSMKHAAFAIKNGKIVGTGFNTISGIKFIHAEISAIKNYLNSIGIKDNLWCKLCG
jgi:hypothetical protein